MVTQLNRGSTVWHLSLSLNQHVMPIFKYLVLLTKSLLILCIHPFQVSKELSHLIFMLTTDEDIQIQSLNNIPKAMKLVLDRSLDSWFSSTPKLYPGTLSKKFNKVLTHMLMHSLTSFTKGRILFISFGFKSGLRNICPWALSFSLAMPRYYG